MSIAIGDSACASELKDVSLRETASDSGVFEGSFDGSKPNVALAITHH